VQCAMELSASIVMAGLGCGFICFLAGVGARSIVSAVREEEDARMFEADAEKELRGHVSAGRWESDGTGSYNDEDLSETLGEFDARQMIEATDRLRQQTQAKRDANRFLDTIRKAVSHEQQHTKPQQAGAAATETLLRIHLGANSARRA